jgi:hypothetical protein
MMRRQLTMRSGEGPSWVCLSALIGAAAALALPGASGTTAAGAALLAVGALALLAGHTWGLMVSIPAHITLVGRVWPELTHAAALATVREAAIAVVLVTALPALALTVVVLPEIARHLVPERSPRMRAVFVAGSALALAAALILPAAA